MALSEEKRREIADLLAKGGTERGVAEATGVSKRTVQNIKKDPKYAPILAAAQRAVTVRQISEQADSVIEMVGVLRDSAPAMEAGLVSISGGILTLFEQAVTCIDPAEITPPQLMGLSKAYCAVVETYAAFTDRVHGLEVLADEVNQITEARTAQAFSPGDSSTSAAS